MGKVQYYYGKGKGKTTAAVGAAMRALGAGLQVKCLLLAKTLESSEFRLLEQLPGCKLQAFGLPPVAGKRQWLVKGKLSSEQRQLGQEALAAARQALQQGDAQVVILDEFGDGPEVGLFDAEELLEALCGRQPGVDVIITGHNPWEGLVQTADLVTEMRKVKHYYDAGVAARRGFEC